MPGPRSGASPEIITDDATIGFDAEGLVMSVSGHAASILGYADPAEVEGLSLAALIGEEAAAGLLDRLHAQQGRVESGGGELLRPHTGTVPFVRSDGTEMSFSAVVTPETSGGWITLVGSMPAGYGSDSSGTAQPTDVRQAMRALSTTAILADREEDLVSQFSTELRSALGAETFLVARSTSASGMYEPVAISTTGGTRSYAPSIELPRALAPAQGAGPVAIESLNSLALFEPVIIAGEEVTGALLAARVEQPGGAHLLLLAVDGASHPWPDDSLLLVEAAALFMASTLRGLRLRDGMGTATRSQETLRQIGVLAGAERNDDFLDHVVRLLGRRLPLAGLSVHGIDPVTSRCFVASASGRDESPLTHSFEWPLAGSLEQHVLRTNAAVLVSAAVADRVTVQPDAVEHWRKSGLQAVISVPLRVKGQVLATLTAGFTSPPQVASEAVRLIETIAPAVQVGTGLVSGKGSSGQPDMRTSDPGYVEPEKLLALTRAASESPDTETLFASVTEWLLEIIPSARVAWGVVDRHRRVYRRIFTYDAASASLPGETEARLDRDELEGLRIPALAAPEPGHGATDAAQSMRAPVVADQQVSGVVMVWPQDGESFAQADLARLQRVCELVAGPLARLLEIQAEREARHALEEVSELGAQAAGFHDPAYALRSVRPTLARLFPHDRALLLEFDDTAHVARVLFDSSAPPNQSAAAELPINVLPGHVIAADRPLTALVQGGGGSNGSYGGARTENAPLGEAASLLAVPLKSNDGASGALLLLSNAAGTYSETHIEWANALSTHLTSAYASWQAHQSNREWTRELREARKQLNSILSSAPVALINLDGQGVCVGLQGQGLEKLGIRREELFGRSIFELTGKLPQIEDAIRQALRGIPALAVASLGLHAAEVWAQPVMEVNGSVSGVTLVGYDVSERIRNKRARAEIRELQALNRERTRFVSAVSHELRNPLTSIVAFTDILSANQTDNLTPEQAHALAVIQKSSERLDRLIQDLLDLSRMDAGDFGLDVTEMDVQSFLEEILDAQLPIFSGAGQSLVLDGPERPCSVVGDQMRLTQVIANLLSNASKYSPAGTTVTVEAAIYGTRLNIAVEDNGPGIPEHQVDRVFDAFYRVDNEATRSVPGTGLGLAIARRITEMHGGEISLESEQGKGTKVTVSLPGVRVREDGQPAPAAVAATAGSRQPKRRRQQSQRT